MVVKVIMIIILFSCFGVDSAFDQDDKTKLEFSEQIKLKERELQNELDELKFDSIVNILEKYGDIHEYMVNNIDRCGRDPIHHSPIPTYFMHIVINMDSVYTSLILERLRNGKIDFAMGIPLVFHLNMSNSEKCKLYNELNWEEYVRNKGSEPHLDQILEFKMRLKCY